MKKNNKYSVLLNTLVLLCFLLPFFYTGCGEKKTEEAGADTATVALPADTIPQIEDSVSQTATPFTAPPDTLKNEIPPDSAQQTSDKDDYEDIALTISRKVPWLAPILVPKEETYTGFAIFINTIQYLPFYAITISFLGLLISLVVKLNNKGSEKLIFIIEITSLVCLILARPFNFSCEILWGYWVTLVFLILMIVFDLYLLKINKTGE